MNFWKKYEFIRKRVEKSMNTKSSVAILNPKKIINMHERYGTQAYVEASLSRAILWK